MQNSVTTTQGVPKLENGLTPLLSKHLDSRALKEHKATLFLELEILAKKFDKFGWERDRKEGSIAQDRMILDWMEALKDYPLVEVTRACRAAVLANPNKMPNEGHVLAQILKARKVTLDLHPKPQEPTPAPRDFSPEAVARRREQSAKLLGKVTGAVKMPLPQTEAQTQANIQAARDMTE